MFIPRDQLAGPHHRVEPTIVNDGLNNRYLIRSTYGDYQVTGTLMAINRIREIAAITRIKELETDAALGEGVLEAGKESLDTVKTIVTDPINTLKSMPKGASRFFGSIGESFKGHKSNYEGGTKDALLGVSSARRKLAASLGVSPYTSNPALNKELDRVAGAKGITDRVLHLGLSVATSGAAGAVVSGVGVSQTMLEAIAAEPPSQIRIKVRKSLLACGGSENVVEAFLAASALSPVHLAVIAQSLQSTGVSHGLDGFLKTATQADSETDAIFLMRCAQLIASYHRDIAPVVELRLVGLLPVAVDQNGTLVVPLHMDYASWTPRAATAANRLADIRHTDPRVTGLALYTDGQISNRFHEELKRLEMVGILAKP